MSFKTQEEIFTHLFINKGKVKYKQGRILYAKDGMIIDKSGNAPSYMFDAPSDWEIYEEPVEEVKWYTVVTMDSFEGHPTKHNYLFRSKEEFLDYISESKNKKESDFEWINLKLLDRGE